MLFPERPIYLYLIIPIKAKWFVVIMGVIELLVPSAPPDRASAMWRTWEECSSAIFTCAACIYLIRLPLRYQEWRRARLRRKFEVYMRKHEKKDDAGRWIN